jgi:hypothetical protein
LRDEKNKKDTAFSGALNEHLTRDSPRSPFFQPLIHGGKQAKVARELYCKGYAFGARGYDFELETRNAVSGGEIRSEGAALSIGLVAGGVSLQDLSRRHLLHPLRCSRGNEMMDRWSIGWREDSVWGLLS